MKVKIEVKSWGKGAYWTYLAPKDNYSWMRNWSMGPFNTKKILLSQKINLFEFHKIAWCP